MYLYSERKKNYQSSLTRKQTSFLNGQTFENGLHYEKKTLWQISSQKHDPHNSWKYISYPHNLLANVS